MSHEEMRLAQERVMSVYSKKPHLALSTIATTASVEDGLFCTVHEGDYQNTTDMPVTLGGTGQAPSPGVFARAAIASCIGIGLKMGAIRSGVDLQRVDVDLEMDFDDSAMFGISDNAAAPLSTRLAIKFDSTATDEVLNRLVDTVLEIDPYFLALRDPQQVSTHIERL